MLLWWATYHPAEPQAGLAGCPQRHVGGGDVRRGRQRFDLPGRLTRGTGAHDVYLTHSEPGANQMSERWAFNQAATAKGSD